MTLLVAMAAAPFTSAQQSHVNLDWAPQKNIQNLTPFGAAVISPEVSDDHTVIFRVKAPDAREVQLSGNVLLGLNVSKPVPFTKGENGIWTLKVGPLKPEIYYYKLIIEVVSVDDPSNNLTGFAGQPGFSIPVVHEDCPEWYDVRNVPHGTVVRHIYHSEVTNGERELYVYLPPDYSTKRTCPVLYLCCIISFSPDYGENNKA